MTGIISDALEFLAAYPSFFPTIEIILDFFFFASLIAFIKFTLIFFFAPLSFLTFPMPKSQS